MYCQQCGGADADHTRKWVCFADNSSQPLLDSPCFVGERLWDQLYQEIYGESGYCKPTGDGRDDGKRSHNQLYLYWHVWQYVLLGCYRVERLRRYRERRVFLLYKTWSDRHGVLRLE